MKSMVEDDRINKRPPQRGVPRFSAARSGRLQYKYNPG
jgi:hypothetical protein